MQGEGRKPRRRYSPKVEALEALRMLDAAATGLLPLAAEFGASTESIATTGSLAPVHAAWDVALDHADLFTTPAGDSRPVEVATAPVQDDPEALQAGLRQMSRYLARSWARAGIGPQHFEDCSQAVYTTLLQQFGRDGFDQTLAEIGRHGIPKILNRDTERGPDFFRAIDMVKKRTLRQKSHLALDDQFDLPESAGADGASADWRGALNDAITRSLNAREADLIQATLQGFSPAEIATRWGVAPKTVSNEKTRALGKLREALCAEMVD